MGERKSAALTAWHRRSRAEPRTLTLVDGSGSAEFRRKDVRARILRHAAGISAPVAATNGASFDV